MNFEWLVHFFDVPVKEALARNASREGKARVPVFGVLRTAKILERLELGEGFDELNRVEIPDEKFAVSESESNRHLE